MGLAQLQMWRQDEYNAQQLWEQMADGSLGQYLGELGEGAEEAQIWGAKNSN